MNLMSAHSVILLLCAAALTHGQPVPTDAALAERIARVENGLQRPYKIRGAQPEPLAIAARMAYHKVPGVSVAVVHNGRIEWARGYGFADVDSGQRVTTDTVFQAASISKSVAAMVAMRLVEQGRLDLDGDVNGKLKSWKVPDVIFTNKAKVTLRRLLSHNAGLTVHGFPGYAAGDPVPTLVQLLDGAKPANTAAVRVDKVPGSGFRYSGGGYAVMQLLVEDVTGKPFDQVARELVLDPLHMTRSAYEQPLGAERARDAASAYRGDGKAIAGRWHTYPEKTAAGLWTTPTDLAKMILELQKPGAVLKPETVKLMLTSAAGNYGLGIGLGETKGRAGFAHGGANEGYRCSYFAYRDSGDGAVVMTNSDNGDALANEILSAIATEYGWVDHLPAEKSVVAVAPEALQALAGDYKFANGPTALVRLRNGQLFIGQREDDMTALLAESPTAFFAPEGGVPPVSFVKQDDGSYSLGLFGGTAKKVK
jgi:CubicO group peptidase (beta-lactamase class C family)